MADKKKVPAYLKPALIWLGATLGVILLLAAVGTGGYFAYSRLYQNKIYPGVSALGVRLDGLTQEEARKHLEDAVDATLEKGLPFILDGQTATVRVSSSDSDMPDLIRYDTTKAVEQAYRVGRDNALQKILFDLLRARVYSVRIPVNAEIDRDRITDALNSEYQSKLPHPKNATFAIKMDQAGEAQVRVVPDANGAEMELAGVFEKLNQQAQALNFQAITLHTKKIQAEKHAADLQPLIDQVKELLQRPALAFTYEDKKFHISTSTLASWVSADMESNKATLDKVAFASSIHALAKDIEVESKSGKLEVKDGKIASFEAGTNGLKVNIDKTLDPVLASWPASSTFPLVVDEERSQITGDNLEQFGIKELIGTGISDFRNSPPNRLKNIRKAVYEHVNGTLIAPGETFSMLKNLGSVDQKHGWFSELVIKGDKTLPEFGGGLCQIGTTMFRAALATGLPVTERRNHSYRVVYYEPAGTDATIYEPAPDLKFLNDTGKYIFLNAYIKGTQVVFEMWGTSDSRQVTQTKPHIYNIASPPPVKLTETLDLPPGKKKCSESAHAGADADFSTTVTYADGTKREESYHSHYRPWGAVCLIGVEKLSDTKAADAATPGTDAAPPEAAAGN